MSATSPPLSPEEEYNKDEYQSIHPHLVSLAIGVLALVLALVFSVLFFCLLLKLGRKKKQQSDCEILRKAVEDPTKICDSWFTVTSVKPKPSPSIFNKDKFLMEELEVVNNISVNLHVDNVSELDKYELSCDPVVALGDKKVNVHNVNHHNDPDTPANSDVISAIECDGVIDTLVCTRFEARNGFSWLYFP